MRHPRILLVEDEQTTRDRIAAVLRDHRFDVVGARDGVEAVARFDRTHVDLVISDQRMPRLDGVGLLRALRRRSPVPFILYSAGARREEAFRAGRLGASRFLEYPFRVEDQLIPTVAELLAADPGGPTVVRGGAARFLGVSPEAERIRDAIRRLGPTRATVLITGETGVGKEVAAVALHEESQRSPLRSLAVPELAESLLEGELFGYERGAFTGATTARAGLFEEADGGTLFLDEIGDASPSVQAKLLRILETGEVRRIGARDPRTVDVRVLAATNRDLLQATRTGSFREDLYWRIRQAELHISPLRKRSEDVPVLIEEFFAAAARRMGVSHPPALPESMASLRTYPWPGNARELRSLLDSALLWWDGSSSLGVRELAEARIYSSPHLDSEERELARRMIEAWSRAGGNQEAARRALELSRAAWRHRWKRLGLADLVGSAR